MIINSVLGGGSGTSSVTVNEEPIADFNLKMYGTNIPNGSTIYTGTRTLVPTGGNYPLSGNGVMSKGDSLYYFRHSGTSLLNDQCKRGVWQNSSDIPTVNIGVSPGTGGAVTYIPEDDIAFYYGITANSSTKLWKYKGGEWSNILSGSGFPTSAFNFCPVVRFNNLCHFFGVSGNSLYHAAYNASTNAWTTYSTFNPGTNMAQVMDGIAVYGSKIYLTSNHTRAVYSWNGSAYTTELAGQVNSYPTALVGNNVMWLPDATVGEFALVFREYTGAGYGGHQYKYSIADKAFTMTFAQQLW